ncbi:Dynein heavy chain 2, axonemal [Perkinsus olseni]|uniref:Dynein heavy chain 2, axonemal n=1 Tax=Perkinsus olseni TaxID=32597 RepID=A0A7J6P735_PEROL|nr:Dynein heavy chain 2, axonemal [Perkinsus olseni]
MMTVHHHDVAERLCSAGEGRVFFWQSQLKYSIDEQGKVWVETLGFRQLYCYEYFGERGRMVMTPTTLRGYHNMFLSLRSIHGTMLGGGSGSGKGALVRGLSRALGRPLLELVCSEQMSFSLIERVLKGMAGGGALCLVRDADKLTGEVLSGLFDTLHRICSAVSCGESELISSGRSLPLMTTFGYFLTTVAEIGLRMAGYSRPWELSRRLSIVLRATEHLMGSAGEGSCCVALLKRILERLPSQEKASMGLQGEVVRALEDVLVPRLRNAGDAELVKSLARELLAGSPVECSAVVAEPDVSQHSFNSKAVELSDMLANGRGALVTGPPCSGKSTMIAAAAAASSGLSSSAVFTVCAGAYCAQEILGSSVWGSGLVTSLLRDHDEGPVWIVLDGCPESAVESLVVLLDNGSLILQSGDRIRVNPGARVVFEVPDLGLLSPALVGRCAMVALGDELTWAMVLDGWCPEGGDTDVVVEVREGVRRFVLGLEAAQSAENGGMLDAIPLRLVAKNSCKLAWSLLAEARSSTSNDAADQQRSKMPLEGCVQRTVMYAVLWSVCSFLGSALEDWHRVEQGDGLGAERPNCHLEMPSEGSLFDYIPAMDASGWLACRSQLNGGCRLLLLPTAPQAGVLALLPRLAASSRANVHTFGSAGGEGTMVVIEDLHLAKQVEGVQPAVEFLRGAMMTRGWLDRSAWRRVRVEGNVHWVVSMTSPLDGGCAGLSQSFGPHSRLLQDAITIGLPSVSDASMEAIYSEVISRVLSRSSVASCPLASPPVPESTATLRGSTGLERVSNVIKVYRAQTDLLSTSMWRYELGRILEACSLGEGQALIRDIRDDILCRADGPTDALEGLLPEQETITAVVDGELETFGSATELLDRLREKLAGTAMSSFALWPDMDDRSFELCVLTRANGHVILLGEQPGSVGKAVGVRLACFLAGVQLRELDASDQAENVGLEGAVAGGRMNRSTGNDHGAQGEARTGSVHVVLCVEAAESGPLEAWARRFPEILKTCVRLRQKSWTEDVRRIVIRAKLEAAAGQFDELNMGKMIEAFLAVAEDDRHLMTLLECFSRLFQRRKDTLEEMLAGARDCCDRLECIVQWIEGTRELFAGGLQPHALGLLTDRIHAVEGSVDTAVAADAAENARPSLEAAEAGRTSSEDALAGPREEGWTGPIG